MDINYLFHRHQVSLMRATSATGSEARTAHRGLVAGYAAQIRRFQANAGATAAPLRAA
ncbi:hypothetical protein [Sphingomonas hengshuiensis]|uniref:hypothetical protein n=1 Tax=Sphingomonas hengshuiensis TaxID=1609977 RepID=UPI000A4C1F3A|nr:hypothetical protein [Sphingomonas hengshuiensis]